MKRPLAPSMAVAFALASSLSVVSNVQAHEFWLSPSSYRAAAHDTVAIAAFVGTGFRGDRKPYAAPRALRFTVTGPKTLDLRPAAINGDLTMARFIVADAGGSVVAYQSDFAVIELPSAEFDAYLRLEGLSEPLAARARLGDKAGSGRERYARCPKTWIAGTEIQRALTAVGLPLEVVPLADPATATPLSVRILFHGKPLAGALVRAWNQPLESNARPREAATRDSASLALQVTTDKDGVAALALDRPGEWLVSAVHMTPCPDRSIADWESQWASFTFTRPEPPAHVPPRKARTVRDGRGQ